MIKTGTGEWKLGCPARARGACDLQNPPEGGWGTGDKGNRRLLTFYGFPAGQGFSYGRAGKSYGFGGGNAQSAFPQNSGPICVIVTAVLIGDSLHAWL